MGAWPVRERIREKQDKVYNDWKGANKKTANRHQTCRNFFVAFCFLYEQVLLSFDFAF